MILFPPEINYFSLFGLNIHYYSMCIFLAIMVSFGAAYYFAGKISSEVDKNVLLDFVPFLVIVSIIGARLYYVLLSIDYYVLNPLSAFMIWQGGLSIHGAFIAGVLFGFFYMKKNRLDFFSYADLIALVLPLGQAIGRFGNFFNQEAIGLPAFNYKVAIFVEKQFRPYLYKDYEIFHPHFLYESILNFIIFLILLFLIKKTAKRYSGLTFFTYILLYSSVRIFLEYLRLDTVRNLLGIPVPALVSAIGIVAGVTGIVIRLKKNKNILH